MKDTKVVWLVEDDRDEADEYKQFLQRGGRLKVKVIDPKKYQSLADFREVAIDPETGAFLIDERLHLSGVDYTGMDLARYLRQIKPELVIYMLTGYPQDIRGIGDVEDVIAKRDMSKASTEYVKRILRSIKKYEEAMSESQKRLDELVELKLAGKLTKTEELELRKLRHAIERPHGLELISTLRKREKEEEDELQILRRISKRLNKIEVRARSLEKRRDPRSSKAKRKRKVNK